MVFQLLGKELETGVLNGKKLEEVWHNGKKIRPEKKPGYTPGPNTMAYFPLISDANDRSGHNNHGVAYNVNWNNGGVMNGNAHINLPNTLPSTRGQATTLSVWFKKHTANQESPLFSNWADNAWYFIADTNNWRFTFNDKSYNYNNRYVPKDTKWHLYTFVYNGASAGYVFIDGILIGWGSDDFIGLKNQQGSYYIGRQGNTYANGIFREAIIENRNRSRKEVSDYYKSSYGMFHEEVFPEWEPGPNTLAYYPLKNNVFDYSGNLKFITNASFTFSGGHADFNGNQKGTIPNITGYKTISFWVNPRVFNFMVFSGGYDFQYYPQVKNDKTSQSNGTINHNYDALYGKKINANQRHHFVLSQYNGKINLYLNGVKYHERVCPIADWAIAFIGYGKYRNGYYLNGKLSEIIIEKKARTDQEIADYYNKTKSAYGL